MDGINKDNKVDKVLIYPEKSKSLNLAFDVTPAKYVTALITEKGVCDASSEGLKKLFN
jgi:methylthioribose-1-phosphate isomerase